MPTGRLIGIACGHGAGGDPGSVPVYVFFHGTKGRLSSHLYADMYFDFVPFDSAVQEARKRTVLFVFWDPSSFRISVFTWGNVASWRGSVILMMMMLIARYKLNMHSSSIQPGWIYFLCVPFTNE